MAAAHSLDEGFGNLSRMDNTDPTRHHDPMSAELDESVEADTCRICRTEATESETLFHPCKCSGSIKYVHQECLMEWLSHSQKKHCELCKTPFRFTKLYSSSMPEAVPMHLMLRHVFVHILKNLRTWLRFGLVVLVWLGCLPYAIRQVWRLLFWFSDGGWPMASLPAAEWTNNSSKAEAVELIHQMLLQEASRATATSPASPLLASQTTPAYLVDTVSKMARLMASAARPAVHNGSDSLPGTLLQSSIPAASISQNQSLPNASAFMLASTSSTLLSEVAFLKQLTRYKFVNQLIISTAEGYVITFLVVICFILIFLIREWVVQQQPGINVGAGFNADFAPVDRARDQAALRADNPILARNIDREERRLEEVERHLEREGRRLMREERRLDREERRLEREERRLDNAARRHGLIGQLPTDSLELEPHDATAEEEPAYRPLPVRDALSPAADIQRMLVEEPRLTEDFIAIWRRAGGDPQEVLRILESEDKDGQMQYWVNLQRRRMHSLPGGVTGQEAPFDQQDVYDGFPQATMADETRTPYSGNNLQDLPDNWYDVDDSQQNDRSMHASVAASDKGKGRAQEEYHNPSPPTIFSSSSGTRPRAISDGPHPSHSKSTLGHGTWTFSNIPDTSENLDLRFSREHERRIQRNSVSSVNSSNFNGLGEDVKLPGAQGTSNQVSDREEGSRSPIDSQHDEDESEMDSWALGLHTDGSPTSSDRVDQALSENDQLEALPGNHNVQNEEPNTQDGLVVPETAPHVTGTAVAIAAPVAPKGILGHVSDFFWGGLDGGAPDMPPVGDDEHVVQDVAAEAPFVPVMHGGALNADAEQEDDAAMDAELAQIPDAAGINANDLDAMEDAEDFDGILDLIGMRGPIFGLAQNAIFSAFLLSLTVAFGIWIPYNIGRLALLLIGNPETAFKLPLRFVFGSAAFIQDLAMSLVGTAVYVVAKATSVSLSLVNWSGVPLVTKISSSSAQLGGMALSLSSSAFERIAEGVLDALIHVGDSDMFAFSAASHESLIKFTGIATSTFLATSSALTKFSVNEEMPNMVDVRQVSSFVLNTTYTSLIAFPGILAKPETWVISLGISERAEPLDLAMSVWSGMDRFWAVVIGYTTLCLLGALYVQKGTPFSTGQVGREWEATIIDLLNQAGGVFKVILIISIEMLVFPLYCGLLLDIALLPIFDNASIMSRLLFTVRSPLTSIFVHWFVGTCYMFHFALFVSMCRKIMRKGVLYFIRDPDDPTFHPVRDVLERNVTTQLRKILFSALVYGALVLVCLGGVVWGLAYTLEGVLPIHWSSNEPVLEFPIDLIFYNFLMPLAVRFFKPSDALHSMYTWWFRKCAHFLRLTWFMFDERRQDEEGHYIHWTRAILSSFDFAGGEATVLAEGDNKPDTIGVVVDANFQRDGRYVRAPASDQVRIPKGDKIFLHVDENNKRIDGQPDQPKGIHGFEDPHYKLLYIPPWFRTRIFIFIFSIWAFAAFTGVSTTIIPLVLGRFVFASFIPPHVRKNDIYAFAIGVYILGSVLYTGIHLKSFYAFIKKGITTAKQRPNSIIHRAATVLSLVTRIAWTYTAFLVVLPTLFAAVVELYFIVPLHSYMALEERHVIHFVQSWTLGLLYVKLTTRFILWHEDSRQARSLKAITRNGYLNPDAWLATRCFILPLGLVLTTALVLPWWIAKISIATFLAERPEVHVLAHRYAYPLFMCAMVILFALYSVWGMLKQWQLMIKDEVYLIGERLHNYGERKSSQAGIGAAAVSTSSNMRRVET